MGPRLAVAKKREVERPMAGVKQSEGVPPRWMVEGGQSGRWKSCGRPWEGVCEREEPPMLQGRVDGKRAPPPMEREEGADDDPIDDGGRGRVDCRRRRW